jgi:UDP-N-acetylmuramoyl-L-alanyl-D-glutamate--2,6-diaminopimelate ligase
MKSYLLLKKHFPLDNVPDCEIAALTDHSERTNAQTVFVCIRGARFDGHTLAPRAYERGCRIFVAEEPLDLPPDACVLLTSNSRKTLSELACTLWGDPSQKMHVIGITGTKGKTTTALLIHKMLNACGVESGYIGTNGVSFCGKHFHTVNTTPESLELFKYLDLMRDCGVKVVVIEVSSQALWTYRVCDVSFDSCIYTNLYRDHIGEHEHPSFAHYKKTKRTLFSDFSPTTVIANSDDGASKYMTRGVKARIISTSAEGKDADWRAEDVREEKSGGNLGVSFCACRGDEKHVTRLALPGKINVCNALLLFALCCDVLGLSAEAVAKSFDGLTIPGRAEAMSIPALPDVTFVIDYAHNGASLSAILKVLRAYSPRRLICLFGSVGERTHLRRGELARAAAEYADVCILTSDNPGREDPEKIISEINSAFPDGYPKRI